MSTYTPSLGLEEITPGTQAGLWGNTTNNNLALIDQAITGVQPIDFAGASGVVRTLELIDGSISATARSAVLNITGTAAGTNTVVVPNKQKTYLVRNNTGQNVLFRTASPTATYTVEAGNSILIFCDGNNNVFTGIAAPSVGTLSVSAGGTGATTFTAGFVKSTGGTNALTSSSTVDLSSDVSGTLPVARGGTGQSTLASGAILTGNGTSGIGTMASGSSGQALVSNGTVYAPANIVNSISAGSGITVSGSTGNISISATGSASGVASFNGRTGPVSSISSDYSSFYPTLSGSNTFSGTNTYNTSSSIQMSAASQGDQRIQVTGGGLSGGLSPNSVQLGGNGIGALYSQNGAWDGSTGIGFILNNQGAANVQITTSNTFYTGAANAYKLGSSTAWIIASDSRIKKNVTPYTKGLSELNQIQIKNFEYNGLAGTKDGEKAVGVIADEIQQILPDTVKTNNIKLRPDDVERTNVKHFDNTELIYLLVNSVKELKAEVDFLKAQLVAK